MHTYLHVHRYAHTCINTYVGAHARMCIYIHMIYIHTKVELDIAYKTTTSYEKTQDNTVDYRSLIAAKKEATFNFDRYIQVFTQKHGFISNLSILDLLFNEGPNTLNYLESQALNN